MRKILKEVIRGEPMGVKEIGNIDIEILNDMVGGNIADKFNGKFRKYQNTQCKYENVS